MRYLGIDYGEKRIGLAVGDSATNIALPRGTVASVQEVADVAGEEGVGLIVVGLPLSFSGNESAQASAIRAFARELKGRVELPIEFENEIFTSKIAERTSAPEHADAAAAAIILQAYLDRKNA